MDTLGFRRTFAVLVPSTNTVVEPEFAAMAVPGVTCHTARIAIPNLAVDDDAGFLRLLDAIRAATDAAIEPALSCGPDALVLGMSAETFWDGPEGAAGMHRALEGRTGLPVTLASEAVTKALAALGGPRRLAILTPYMPVGDARVRTFFEAEGFEVVSIMGLRCASPQAIARVGAATLRDSVAALDGPGVEAIVQVGTNLPFAKIAAHAEFWLGKPVLAINTATWWWALRSNGIGDRVHGFGRLLEMGA
jgi:maleate isomerase